MQCLDQLVNEIQSLSLLASVLLPASKSFALSLAVGTLTLTAFPFLFADADDFAVAVFVLFVFAGSPVDFEGMMLWV